MRAEARGDRPREGTLDVDGRGRTRPSGDGLDNAQRIWAQRMIRPAWPAITLGIVALAVLGQAPPSDAPRRSDPGPRVLPEALPTPAGTSGPDQARAPAPDPANAVLGLRPAPPDPNDRPLAI